MRERFFLVPLLLLFQLQQCFLQAVVFCGFPPAGERSLRQKGKDESNSCVPFTTVSIHRSPLHLLVSLELVASSRHNSVVTAERKGKGVTAGDSSAQSPTVALSQPGILRSGPQALTCT